MFQLPPKFAKSGINAVTVSLNERDLYDVVFRKVRGSSVETVLERQDVYSENLRAVFSSATGLDTSL